MKKNHSPPVLPEQSSDCLNKTLKQIPVQLVGAAPVFQRCIDLKAKHRLWDFSKSSFLTQFYRWKEESEQSQTIQHLQTNRNRKWQRIKSHWPVQSNSEITQRGRSQTLTPMPVLSPQQGILQKWAEQEAPEVFQPFCALLQRQGCWCWAQAKQSPKDPHLKLLLLPLLVQHYKLGQ